MACIGEELRRQNLGHSEPDGPRPEPGGEVLPERAVFHLAPGREHVLVVGAQEYEDRVAPRKQQLNHSLETPPLEGIIHRNPLALLAQPLALKPGDRLVAESAGGNDSLKGKSAQHALAGVLGAPMIEVASLETARTDMTRETAKPAVAVEDGGDPLRMPSPVGQRTREKLPDKLRMVQRKVIFSSAQIDPLGAHPQRVAMQQHLAAMKREAVMPQEPLQRGRMDPVDAEVGEAIARRALAEGAGKARAGGDVFTPDDRVAHHEDIPVEGRLAPALKVPVVIALGVGQPVILARVEILEGTPQRRGGEKRGDTDREHPAPFTG